MPRSAVLSIPGKLEFFVLLVCMPFNHCVLGASPVVDMIASRYISWSLSAVFPEPMDVDQRL